MDKTKLEQLFESAKADFVENYLLSLDKEIKYSVNRADGLKNGSIKQDELLNKFKGLSGASVKNFKDSFIKHLGVTEGYLAYCSPPKAFEKAWKFRKTKISSLSLFEVQELLSDSAQLIPMIKSENILNSGEKGMITSNENNSFLYGIRHSKGNYDDELDDGGFSYQPPFDVLGMLRYRWLEYLSIKCHLPIYFYITMWFKHEAFSSTNHVSMLCPVKINGINKNFDAPLYLKLISVDESIERSMMMRSMDLLDITSKIRPGLPEEYVIKFNYENIKSNIKLRNQLINWAIKKAKKCPGSKCRNIEFSKILPRTNIHFGHIVPQSWAGVFQFLQEKNHVHHPDNLYLSCGSCNTSLNSSFPDDKLRENILNEKFGTVGDYIRSDIDYFSRATE